METLPSLGRDIVESRATTWEVYGDLLRQPENASAIHATHRETFSNGCHDRQKLDLYMPSRQAPKPAECPPILIFAYGGGFVSGDKRMAAIQGGIVYTNVGYFFSEKLGFETIVMDYRLLGDGAKYPSGGEDIDALVSWVEARYGAEERKMYLMGNSAGGVHLATWLFGKKFAARRHALSSGTVLELDGGVFLGAPFRLDTNGPMKDTLSVYYGTSSPVEKAEPTGLMEYATGKQPRILVAASELDPLPFVEAGKEFVDLLERKGECVQFLELMGHNHFSPALSLGTGIEKEEAWGFKVGKWMMEKAGDAYGRQ